MRILLTIWLFVLLACGSACSQAQRVDGDADSDSSEGDADSDSDIPADGDQDELPPPPLVDVLYVLEAHRYGSYVEGRETAPRAILELLLQLAAAAELEGDDLRFGAVTTDLGAPGSSYCQGEDGESFSDGARLVSPCWSGEDHCEEAPDTFLNLDSIEFVLEFDMLEDPIHWSQSCSIAQHLQTLLQALSEPDNAGFFRPGAHLVIVLFAANDDCSFLDGAFLSNNPEDSFSARCAIQQDDLLEPQEMAQDLSEHLFHRDLTIVLLGGEDRPVQVAETEHGGLDTITVPCDFDGDIVTPTPRIHRFLDELSSIRDDEGVSLRFDTCAPSEWVSSNPPTELVEQLTARVVGY